MKKYWNISSPIIVHVEVTEACNERCNHCYNFERSEKYKPRQISWDNLDNTIEELHNNRVFHVIVTGGEPLLVLDKTCALIKQCQERGMSTSLNSNLLAATEDSLKTLKHVGLTHILTTLHGHNAEVHDYIANTKGAFNKISQNIMLAQKIGIRVTVNLILLQPEIQNVYLTGEYCSELGVKKFLANRCIPSPTNSNSYHLIKEDDAKKMFDDLLKLKSSRNINVGTCRMVPECFFEDLDKYADFIGRGCSAGRRHMLLNVNGDSHACVHESKTYGNIHEIGLKGCWQNMKEWRSDAYIPDKCKECYRFESCEGGCRLIGLASQGTLKGEDNLCKKSLEMMTRKEEGFIIERIRGGQVKFQDV